MAQGGGAWVLLACGGTLAGGGGRVVVIDRAAHGGGAAPTPLMLSCFITRAMPSLILQVLHTCFTDQHAVLSGTEHIGSIFFPGNSISLWKRASGDDSKVN